MTQSIQNDPYVLARYIKEATKTTPVKLYIKGNLTQLDFDGLRVFGDSKCATVFGEYRLVKNLLDSFKEFIDDYELEYDRRNSAIPMLNTNEIDARIEPGAIIRDKVTIGKSAVIMMGAVLNIGAEIGSGTMIDMNAVVGARGIIGNNCHIGAGAVIAGVLEPPGKSPVIIEDDVLVGANAVVLEGVHIGKGAVVAAGAVVTADVAPNTVVAGMPAQKIKEKDELTAAKTEILQDLRR
ncbi:2,3,4,5-tetrahydropyridine-2,6-dicarboxylate N-acetyltransferase [Candidatus Sumerlaeota bacterium]|nr:2,3,4,5-tetrahydropyridine-2,6-dicarboxylate N-acetyltransferase [Candidatus Sumerlaeota bacterium]